MKVPVLLLLCAYKSLAVAPSGYHLALSHKAGKTSGCQSLGCSTEKNGHDGLKACGKRCHKNHRCNTFNFCVHKGTCPTKYRCCIRQCSPASDLKLTKKNKGWDVYWKFQYGYKPMMAGGYHLALSHKAGKSSSCRSLACSTEKDGHDGLQACLNRCHKNHRCNTFNFCVQKGSCPTKNRCCILQCSPASDLKLTKKNKGWDVYEKKTAAKPFDMKKGGFTFKGFEPTMAHKNAPVFMWVDGTSCNWNDPADLQIVKAMANQGFTSATLKHPYDNSLKGYPAIGFNRCGVFNARARQVAAALNVLCTRPSADCSKGVALAGFSQGAQLVSLVAGWQSHLKHRITAIFTIGNSAIALLFGVPSKYPCLDYHGGLSKNRRREVHGSQDSVLSVNGVAEATGYHCGKGKANCIQKDGSGYIFSTTPNYQSHCPHIYHPTPDNKWCTGAHLGPTWVKTKGQWGMQASLKWLAKRARKGKEPDVWGRNNDGGVVVVHGRRNLRS